MAFFKEERTEFDDKIEAYINSLKKKGLDEGTIQAVYRGAEASCRGR